MTPGPPLQRLAADVRKLAPVGDEAMVAFMALLEPRGLVARECLLQAGEPAQWCCYVVEGLVREFHIDAQGSEHTRAFADAGHFSGSLLDLLSGQASLSWVQALEPTQTLVFRYTAFDALCMRWPQLNTVARRATEQVYVRKAQREYQLLALSAAERYAQWRLHCPGLDTRVNKRVLASYLGITPEHLSRLRRALASG